ncbi:Lipase class 3 [Penicillium taxi]|uniref:Lipase class 3 n=1 Tax=Penicillium taxi TaxID=168475 RepID=UPI00254590C6|nr:Lipase class 3 [Penicillium taxi]KAJ5893566.1 Lipase class 3 [Penicillium taxi]
MEGYSTSEDATPRFCIGHYQADRDMMVSTSVVQKVHESNYDMMTVPITTEHFHSRVLSLLSSFLSNLQSPAYDPIGTMGTTQNTRLVSIPPLSKLDSNLTPNEATSQLVGVTSSWIDLCSPDPLIADLSRQVLMLEVAYAAFCGIGYLLIPSPKLHHGSMHSEGVVHYAKVIQDALSLGPFIQFHIWLRMVDDPDLEMETMGDLAPLAREEYIQPEQGGLPKLDPFGTWDAWDLIRKTCKYHTRLFVALSMPKQLPSLSVLSRWHSEPVHLLTIDASSFLKNQKGFPVLSKAHQAFIAKLMRLRTPPWIILCDVGPIPGIENADDSGTKQPHLSGSDYPSLSQVAGATKKHFDPTPHLSYVRNLQQRQPPRTLIERFGTGYQDYLQAPLQPLTVNLESITYEVFEKDPIKYEWYERAITKALRDWADQKKPTSHPDGKVVVAVVGAGRGPLVTRALKASAAAGVEIDMWAVEKNQNAFVLLQRHNDYIWNGKVTLVQSDMRSWKGPRVRKQAADEAEGEVTHVDILVSELLGSFADNELSPECLDGVNGVINPEHGISIPASYTAHLTPISAPKLHSDVMNQTVTNPAAPEIPYVVMLHAIDFLSSADSPANAETGNQNIANRSSTLTTPTTATEFPVPNVQTAWSFSHPNPNTTPQNPMQSTISNAHNVRRTRLAFPVQNRGACHGLAGYFETVLYKDVELSTNPVTMDAKSASMISWFPIYFPLKTPLNVPDNGEIVVTMYRQTDDRKVWYEWMVEVFALQQVSTSSNKTTSPLMSGGRSSSPSVESLKNNAGRQGYRRVRVGLSELHSSIKDGCLM